MADDELCLGVASKRALVDEQLCLRFQKRLRIDSPRHFACNAEPQSGPYRSMNSLLQGLHREQAARRAADVAMGSLRRAADAERRRASADEAMATGPEEEGSCSAASGSAAGPGGGPPASTSFSLADVVQCGHGLGGRCLQCSGRLVQQLPLPLYSAFCAAYPGGPSSSPVTARGRAALAAELSFPAFAALAGCLAPEPGERLLHLGSGTGRAVLAWALLLPGAAACGVETCPLLHAAASAASSRLDPEARERVYLHCGDLFASRGEWHQASTILISTAGFDDALIESLLRGLERLQAGTRVVAVSRPLCADPDRAPHGLVLHRQAQYRTTGSGNATVFIYRKPGAR